MIEPISTSIGILASVLSIASSIKELTTKRHISKQEALQIYLRKAGKEERELLAKPGIQDAVVEITVISKDLLDQLMKEAQACEKQHIRGRKQANSQQEKRRADNKAAQCMCGVLRDIKFYNKGKLPTSGPFQDWWDSYDCAE